MSISYKDIAKVINLKEESLQEEKKIDKKAEAVFDDFLKAFKLKKSKGPKDVGGYELEFNPTSGTYNIAKISNAGGASSNPFGYEGRKAKEFIACLLFAMRALQAKKK